MPQDPSPKVQTTRSRVQKRVGGTPKGLQLDDEAFGYVKRVIVTPAVYLSLFDSSL